MNHFDQAETHFLKSIGQDDQDPRPYLALSYIMQLKEDRVKAWEWYAKALNCLENPYPYLYAAMLTTRGKLEPEENEKEGLLEIISDLTDHADAGGILNAGANEILGRYYQEFGSMDEAREYYGKLNTVDDWCLSGPYENIAASGFEKVYEPEHEFRPEARLTGKNGMPADWFKVEAIRPDRWIDFMRYFAEQEGIFYANTFISSPEDKTVQIRVGTSGSVKVFLNDEQIISCFDENNKGNLKPLSRAAKRICFVFT